MCICYSSSSQFLVFVVDVVDVVGVQIGYVVLPVSPNHEEPHVDLIEKMENLDSEMDAVNKGALDYFLWGDREQM